MRLKPAEAVKGLDKRPYQLYTARSTFSCLCRIQTLDLSGALLKQNVR